MGIYSISSTSHPYVIYLHINSCLGKKSIGTDKNIQVSEDQYCPLFPESTLQILIPAISFWLLGSSPWNISGILSYHWKNANPLLTGWKKHNVQRCRKLSTTGTGWAKTLKRNHDLFGSKVKSLKNWISNYPTCPFRLRRPWCNFWANYLLLGETLRIYDFFCSERHVFDISVAFLFSYNIKS